MIITFCGHSTFVQNEVMNKILYNIYTDIISDNEAELYIGNYGSFDNFAYHCGAQYRETHKNTRLVFVTPYLTDNYIKSKTKMYHFDDIVYPDLENVPPRFAITYRNKWMIDKSDIVIAYINRDFGGAYQSFKHAVKCKKKIINLADL